MLNRILLVAIFFLGLLNCTHTRYIPLNNSEENLADYEAIRKKSGMQTAKLLSSTDTYSASDIRISSDSTSFVESKTGNQKTITTESLREISFRDRGKGVIEGIGMGALIGFSTGFTIGYFSYKEGEFNLGDSRFESGIVGGVGLGAPAAVIGLIAGAIKCSENKYVTTRDTFQIKK